jgi:hypothetical protein
MKCYMYHLDCKSATYFLVKLSLALELNVPQSFWFSSLALPIRTQKLFVLTEGTNPLSQ